MPVLEVAFNIPLRKTFHYLSPPTLPHPLVPGMRVLAPFGRRERMGFILHLLEHSPIRELKLIRRVIDPVPVIAEERWALAEWITRYYGCSLGEALAAMVPQTLRLPSPVPAHEVQPHGGASRVTGSVEDTPRTLSSAQHRALTAITTLLDQRMSARRGKGASSTMLLHGVTGSGKTELYLRAIAHVLSRGGSGLCLIPEIALTPQTVERFRARFGDLVAVWHSRMTAKERSREWSRIAVGTARVAVGARSAVFAPLKKLGLIILDEEHESTYKQEDSPRYHAREVAQARMDLVGGGVVLGSATPSVEVYYAATQHGGHLESLPERVTGYSLPKVELVDLRQERGARGRLSPLSGYLQRALQQTLDRGEQAMLLLNRRGFARIAQCSTCGVVTRCARCAVPMIYHAARAVLLCHYCNAQEAMREDCGVCEKGSLRLRGSGTERVESELHRLFPTTAIVRMDRDTTKRPDAHREIYESLRSHRTSVLVGTQMIAKGFDFPQVTLVGVVSADTALNLPDFRSGERTFDLLTQVAGRAGRGAQPGRVVIQTYCPDHYAIQAARTHNYQQFYHEELTMRRRLRLPPFVHLVALTVIGRAAPRVMDVATILGEQLRALTRGARIAVVGPAPHRIPRVRSTSRVCLLLKGKRVEPMVTLLMKTLTPDRTYRGLPVLVDVDPL